MTSRYQHGEQHGEVKFALVEEGSLQDSRTSALDLGSPCASQQKLSPFRDLSILDKLLAPLIVIAMIIGVVIGKFADGVHEALTGAELRGVSLPILIGLLVMMWPILTKVQYERLPAMFRLRSLWKQIFISLILNWIIGPFVMLGIAWATLPDLPTYRTGVIMVGLARCIAMVMIWNTLAGGNTDLCAILVLVNSVLQLILFSPMSIFFVRVISGDKSIRMTYSDTAIAVLIYLGIPLAAGFVTRFAAMAVFGKKGFGVFMKWFGPLALLGLLYTIILICAEQAERILDNIGNVFRVFVPMITYFIIMWAGTFISIFYLARRSRDSTREERYQMAVVQSFTAGSNNFELAIAVCVAIYGVNSDQALAATIGPLVEVPVLLLLSYFSLYLRDKLDWGNDKDTTVSA